MDNMDKIKILRSMFGDIKLIAPDVFYIIEDENITIYNIDYEILDSGNTNEVNILGTFVLHKYKDYHILSNYNSKNSIRLLVKSDKRATQYINISDSFIATLDFGNECIIYNANLDKVFKIPHCFYINAYKETDISCWFTYKYESYHGAIGPKYILSQKGYVNKLSKNIEIYGGFELDEQCSAVSTELAQNFDIRLKKCNAEALPILRYRLAVHGNIVGEKSYYDIVVTARLHNSKYAYCVELSNKNKHCYGIIDRHGKELLPPIYDNIDYIGGECFILNSNGQLAVYNIIKQQLLLNFYTIKNYKNHETLPITLVTAIDNNVYAVDVFGRVFNILDIAKYFDCSYSEQNPNILKINIRYENTSECFTKYVTNTLIPITNLKKISELLSDTWIKM